MADALTLAYKRRLLGLRAAFLRDLRPVWSLFDPNDMRTWPAFLGPATALVQTHHDAAVALGARYYEALRARRAPHLPANELTLPPVQVDPSKVATNLAATGLAGTFGALRAGKSMAAALDNGFVRAGMSGGRLVMQGGREAVLAATRGDASARGYIRVVDDDGCEWCRSLAGQRTSPTAFQAHDGCGCTAEPVWH